MSRLTRRGLLSGGAMALAAIASPRTLSAFNGVNDPHENKVVRLYNPNTGERLRATYWRSGWFDGGALTEISLLLRDWRQDQAVDFDPYVIDRLHSICAACGFSGEIVALSGYRTKATNDWLRRQPRYNAAENSLHLYGRALDFTLPAASLFKVGDVARHLGGGGVGYYPKQHFVHIDTGEERYWTG